VLSESEVDSDKDAARAKISALKDTLMKLKENVMRQAQQASQG